LIYFLGIIIALMAGAIYTNNLAFLLCFFLVAIILAGMQQTNSNLKGIQIETFKFPLVEEGKKGEALVWIKNNNKEDRHQIIFESKHLGDNFNFQVDRLPAQSLTPIRFSFQAGKFGKKNITKIQTSTTFPFGLFRSWRNQSVDSCIHIYPEKKGSKVLPSTYPLDHYGNQQEKGDDFSEHKNYEQGDSIKNIDWKAYARGRPLMTKVFSEGANQILSLNLSEIESGSYKSKLNQLSLWVHLCSLQSRPYELIVDKMKIPVNAGHTQETQCLKALSSLGQTYE